MSSAAMTMGGPVAAAAPAMVLPPLRDDLHLHEGPRGRDGAPSWTLEDPSRSRFYRIGWPEVEMLARWDLRDPENIADAIADATTLDTSSEDVRDFAGFLAASNLLQVSGKEANARLQRQAASLRTSGAMWLLKNYLFVRVPLLRPDRFLDKTLPLVAPFYSRAFLFLTIAAGVIGLALVARQWDTFLHTFLHFFSIPGAILAALTLSFAKLMHELGHAYTAKRFGCRVTTMGVALLVMWPVLYTDTSGAWKLRQRSQRLAIGGAGMIVETGLAAYATLLWSFLPDGMLRSAVFMLATTTWVLTLAINLNPFMRYDGYYLASDFLEVPNLQERAFRLARWRLREWLFGFGEPKPENFEPGLARVVTAYGFGTWIYRFTLFLGIALIVYHYFFKALGVVLFAVEIIYFIARPIFLELTEWVQRRAHYRFNRNTAMSLTALGVLLLAVLLPWRTSIQAPALMRAAGQAQLFAPSGARLAAILVHPGDKVTAGQPLFRFISPDFDHQLRAVQWQISVLRWQGLFQILDKEELSNTLVVHQQLAAALAEQAAITQQQEKLTVKAPLAGVMADQADPLAPGEWVAEGEQLGTIVAPQGVAVEALVSEADLARIRAGAMAHFRSEDPMRPGLALVVEDVAQTATRSLDATPELASTFGGGVATNPPSRGEAPVPEGAVYRVRLLAADGGAAAPTMALRGTVSIDGEAQSLFARAWNVVAARTVRETGF